MNLNQDINPLLQKIKYILSWIKKKVELNEVYFGLKPEDKGKPYVTSGEIYYADLGTNIGSEIDKKRPVVVFQKDEPYIRQSNLVFVIPISSNTKINPHKVFFKDEDLLENDGILESAVLIQQAKSISKNRLEKYKGKFTENKMREISICVFEFLFKTNPLQMEGDAQVSLEGPAKNVLRL